MNLKSLVRPDASSAPPQSPPSGVLERLRREAQDLETQAAIALATARARRLLMEQKVLPRLDALRRFFGELGAYLCTVDPPVEVRYDLPGVGTLENLRQGSYRTVDASAEAAGGFRFRFDCTRPGTLRVSTSAKTLAAHRARLTEHGLSVETVDRGRAGGLLVIEQRVPVEIRFEPDLERGAVTLRITNLEGLGTVTYALAPERIDAALMDALARWLLREPNEFRARSGNALSAASRSRLRARLDGDRLRRDEEPREPTPTRRRLRALWPRAALTSGHG